MLLSGCCRGKPAECAEQRVLRFVVIGDDVQIIVANAGQFLLREDRLQHHANAEIFSLLREAQCFRSVGERFLRSRNLRSERLDAGLT